MGLGDNGGRDHAQPTGSHVVEEACTSAPANNSSHSNTHTATCAGQTIVKGCASTTSVQCNGGLCFTFKALHGGCPGNTMWQGQFG
jgi:hypothetical protein